jgi:hypothetical protein
LLFYLGIVKPLSLRSSLPLPYMLGLDIFLFLCSMFFVVFLLLFSTKKKKRNRRKMQIFIPLFSFSDILCIFTWYLSSWCINYIGFNMTESSCLIFAKFPCCIYLIDSCFPHAMKMCTIQGFPKVHFFYLLLSLIFCFWIFFFERLFMC